MLKPIQLFDADPGMHPGFNFGVKPGSTLWQQIVILSQRYDCSYREAIEKAITLLFHKTAEQDAIILSKMK